MKRTGPCLDKKCAECCDPVKVARFMPDSKIPKDAENMPLWKKRTEILVPEDAQQTKLETYDCKNFDVSTGKCMDYEHRPDICRDSGCVDPKSSESVDEQYRKLSEQKYIKIR